MEKYGCVYTSPNHLFPHLAELAVFKFLPHSLLSAVAWKTAIICSQVAFCWSIFGSDI